MDNTQLFSYVDHTLLAPTATQDQIWKLCDEAIQYGAASVCIPPSYVAPVKQRYGDGLVICTVIGFPLGYNTTAIKRQEAEDAVKNGATELDMVINLGWVKDKRFDDVQKEIEALKSAVGNNILKVIVETCYLDETEKIAMCKAVSQAKADYIKTSTGFGTGGATREDVALFAKHIAPGVKIKAAGGIRTRQDMEDFIALGASRLGTSSAVSILVENA